MKAKEKCIKQNWSWLRVIANDSKGANSQGHFILSCTNLDPHLFTKQHVMSSDWVYDYRISLFHYLFIQCGHWSSTYLCMLTHFVHNIRGQRNAKLEADTNSLKMMCIIDLRYDINCSSCRFENFKDIF